MKGVVRGDDVLSKHVGMTTVGLSVIEYKGSMKMFRIKLALFLLVILISFPACHTLTSSEAKNAHDKKTAAAGINIQLGMAYVERHEIQRAKQKFLTALREAPQLPEAWYSMAYFFEITGDMNRASRCYLRALELAPKRGDAHNNYGTFLCRSHHYQAAIKHFIKATQDIEYLDAASAYENAGLCAELIPAIPLAIQYFETALKQEPNRPVSMLSLAELNNKLGHYAEARRFLNQYLTVSTETADARALGLKLKRKGY